MDIIDWYNKGDIINLKGTHIGLVLNNGIDSHKFAVLYMGQKIEYIQVSLESTHSIVVDQNWLQPHVARREIYYELLIGDMKGWTSLRDLRQYDYMSNSITRASR